MEVREDFKIICKKDVELFQSVALIRKHVKTMNEQNELLKKQNSLLADKIEDLEQYGRRTFLKFSNLTYLRNPTKKQLLKTLEIKCCH